MSNLFDGKVVFITGAGAGIGQACAEAFAAAKAKVAVADISAPAAQAVVAGIREAGGEAISLVGDVSVADQVDRMVTTIIDTWGKLDIGVNNAGISTPIQPLAETCEDDFDRLMAINVKGVWLCMRAELKQMLKQGGGNIINMASALSLRVYPGSSFYVTSKFAVAGMTRTAAVEYAQANIRINAVCPGNVKTPLLEKSVTDPQVMKGIVALQAMNRLGTPQEIANAVLWLASDQASFCTGNVMPIDGGWTAG